VSLELPKKKDFKQFVISTKLEACFSRMYRISPETIGPVSVPVEEDYNGEECQTIIGTTPEENVLLVLWYQKSFQMIEDANNNRSNPFPFAVPLIERSESVEAFVDLVRD
jgi:hypothetical protein